MIVQRQRADSKLTCQTSLYRSCPKNLRSGDSSSEPLSRPPALARCVFLFFPLSRVKEEEEEPFSFSLNWKQNIRGVLVQGQYVHPLHLDMHLSSPTCDNIIVFEPLSPSLSLFSSHCHTSFRSPAGRTTLDLAYNA